MHRIEFFLIEFAESSKRKKNYWRHNWNIVVVYFFQILNKFLLLQRNYSIWGEGKKQIMQRHLIFNQAFFSCWCYWKSLQLSWSNNNKNKNNKRIYCSSMDRTYTHWDMNGWWCDRLSDSVCVLCVMISVWFFLSLIVLFWKCSKNFAFQFSINRHTRMNV